MTAPSDARRSLERTNAPPLPGFTCWNSRILKTVPSTSMWLPFLNWLVEIVVISPSGGESRCCSAPGYDGRSTKQVLRAKRVTERTRPLLLGRAGWTRAATPLLDADRSRGRLDLLRRKRLRRHALSLPPARAAKPASGRP